MLEFLNSNFSLCFWCGIKYCLLLHCSLKFMAFFFVGLVWLIFKGIGRSILELWLIVIYVSFSLSVSRSFWGWLILAICSLFLILIIFYFYLKKSFYLNSGFITCICLQQHRWKACGCTLQQTWWWLAEVEF